MAYRRYDPPQTLLIGYDPQVELPTDHLARFVDTVVDECLQVDEKPRWPGQPAFHPALVIKILVYGYAIGLRSSRQLERMCRECLPFLFLTRGDTPSYRTLCWARIHYKAEIESVWQALFDVAEGSGIRRLGRIVVDSTKVRANASDESVVTAEEMPAVLAQIEQILREAKQVDQKEERDGSVGETQLGKPVSRDQMRDILRAVRKKRSAQRRNGSGAEPSTPDEGTPSSRDDSQTRNDPSPEKEEPIAANASPTASDAPSGPIGSDAPSCMNLTKKMRDRLCLVWYALKEALASGAKYLSTTDIEAQMMGEGRHKRVMMCYGYEVAVDNGLLVAAGVSREPNDNGRLLGLVNQAAANEPGPIRAVDADSGYYSGRSVGALAQAGIDVCIPTTATACDLRRGLPLGTTAARAASSTTMIYVPDGDYYVCPEDKKLLFSQMRTDKGVDAKIYRAQSDCTGCPLAEQCLTQRLAKRRTLTVPIENALLTQLQERFQDAAHQSRYHHRAEAVETVFGFTRANLGVDHWMVRGTKRVEAEATLLSAAYQVRKVHKAIQSREAPKWQPLRVATAV